MWLRVREVFVDLMIHLNVCYIYFSLVPFGSGYMKFTTWGLPWVVIGLWVLYALRHSVCVAQCHCTHLVLGGMLHYPLFPGGSMYLSPRFFLCGLLSCWEHVDWCCYHALPLVLSLSLSFLSCFFGPSLARWICQVDWSCCVKSFRLIFPSYLPMWMVANMGYILQV